MEWFNLMSVVGTEPVTDFFWKCYIDRKITIAITDRNKADENTT